MGGYAVGANEETMCAPIAIDAGHTANDMTNKYVQR